MSSTAPNFGTANNFHLVRSLALNNTVVWKGGVFLVDGNDGWIFARFILQGTNF